jgi:4-amino-4-deoxy-L-arabinose transferase-like glycosyltransferase
MKPFNFQDIIDKKHVECLLSITMEKNGGADDYSSCLRQVWIPLFIIILIIPVILFRIHLLSVPLERDEGEYAYAGQLMLQGVSPFLHVYNMKMPGIYLAYAAVLGIFGQTQTAIHLGLLIVNLLSSIILYFLGKRLYNVLVGGSAAVSFSVLSLSSSVLGLSANAEHFVVLFALSGLLFLFEALYKKNNWLLILSGFMLGTCFLMKQHGAVFIFFGMIMLFWHGLFGSKGGWKPFFTQFLFFCTGVCTPMVSLCIWLWHTHTVQQFWFWTVTYAHTYTTQVKFAQGLRNFSDGLLSSIASSPIFWLLASGGWIYLLVDKTSSMSRIFIVTLIIMSLTAICPGFYFREHYFILILPAISLLSGICINAISVNVARKTHRPFTGLILAGIILCLALTVSFYRERRILFQLSPEEVSRFIYGANPFPESLVFADSLKAWTVPADKIAVIGSEPQIFFYSHRMSATGYIYTYAMMENHSFALQMQKEMICEIESAAPGYIVFVNVPASWLPQPGSSYTVFEWFNRIQRDFYHITGIAEIISDSKTEYRWGNDAKKYVPHSLLWLAVLKRNSPDTISPDNNPLEQMRW